MKKHIFPKQIEPGFDLIMTELIDHFGEYSLDVHDAIISVMLKNKISLQDKKIRKMLAEMAIKLTQKMSNYDF